jgi:hypothetical protein
MSRREEGCGVFRHGPEIVADENPTLRGSESQDGSSTADLSTTSSLATSTKQFGEGAGRVRVSVRVSNRVSRDDLKAKQRRFIRKKW